jgi:hypothetical protein
MIHGEGCGNDCGVFHSTPESAWRDNPLNIPVRTFCHSPDRIIATTSHIHLPLLINDQSKQSLGEATQQSAVTQRKSVILMFLQTSVTNDKSDSARV